MITRPALALLAAVAVSAGALLGVPSTASAATSPVSASPAPADVRSVVAGWANSPATCPSSAVTDVVSTAISGGLAVIDEIGYQCSFVSAYRISDGSLVWRQPYHFARWVSVDDGVAYIRHDDPATGAYILEARDVATGALKYSTDHWGDATMEAAGSGLVGAGQYYQDAATGDFAFQIKKGSTTWGNSLIAGGRLFYNDPWDVTAYSTTGALLWTATKTTDNLVSGPAAGDATPVLFDGRLYVHSTSSTAKSTTWVLDPATGRLLDTLPNSSRQPGLDGDHAFIVEDRGLDAIDLTTHVVDWTYKAPAGNAFATTPVAEDGILWITLWSEDSESIQIVAIDEATGRQLGAAASKCDIPSSQNDGFWGANVVADGVLYAATDCGIQTYRASTAEPVPVVTPTPTPSPTPTPTPTPTADPAPTPTPAPTGPELLADPGFQHGHGGFAGLASTAVRQIGASARTGSKGIAVASTSKKAAPAGIMQATVVTKAKKLSAYTTSCWVRASKPGLKVGIRLVEFTPSKAPKTALRTMPPHAKSQSLDLATTEWTKITSDNMTRSSGTTLAPQIWSPALSSTSGSILVDDCTVYRR